MKLSIPVPKQAMQAVTILVQACALVVLQGAGNSLFGYHDANDQCLTCHGEDGLTDEAGRSLFVPKAQFEQSVHGKSGISCVNCHADLKSRMDFPHAENLAKVNCATCHDDAQKNFDISVHSDATPGQEVKAMSCVSCHGHHDIAAANDVHSRTHPLNQPQTCGTCHFSHVKGKRGSDFVKDFLQSTHGIALSRKGLSTSATCSTCHGSHDVKRTPDPSSPMSRRRVPDSCGHCHAGILKDYLEGVHGKDFAKGIRDVPVCTDCHGEHQILSPQNKHSKVFSTQVALTCARCHDNEELIQRYALPAKRLRTFQGSFHGVASAYGETRVANCSSCHGFHNIRSSSDPNSTIHPTHLPQTCGQCHPGAGERLSQVKIHVLDQKSANYAGYIIQKAYLYLMTIMIGSFIIYIAADLKSRLVKDFRKN